MTRPLLVVAWGNRSRGDDALGPLLAERLQARLEGGALAARVEFIEDYQLQIEHALDLVGRERVLFVDASRDARAPFEASALHAQRDASFTTHAMSPASVLHVYEMLHGAPPPPCTLLAVRGDAWDLGAAPCAGARAHLEAASAWAWRWVVGGAGEPG